MSDADLLTLTQWLSPAFPVGGYAYSHGLETAISSGEVTTAKSLESWVSDVLMQGSGLADAVLLTAAMAPGADVAALADHARALAASRERWTETRDQGAAFTSAHNALTDNDFPVAPLPIAVGRAARELTLPPVRVAALYLHAFAGNLTAGATRFIPLGQTEGQQVLAGLHPIILQVAELATKLSPDQITSGTPGADLAAMRHETLETRIFRT